MLRCACANLLSQVISGSAGATVYSPITAALFVPGSSVSAGSVLGKTTTDGYLHFTYTPNGGAFAVSTAVDPNPCFCKCNPVFGAAELALA